MERSIDGTPETAINLCTTCDESFVTLVDEKDDTCGACHCDAQAGLKKTWLIQNGRCIDCEDIPTRSTARFCKTCRDGFNESDLSSHDKG